ncbi:glycosyltransferase family 9 protein [Psychromonas sp. MME2]|uniref:glycosyltransferase family 9 protein n=1 Tax=unclassified Psychromonas TaxID=2614957 RepID=UPI00339BD07B
MKKQKINLIKNIKYKFLFWFFKRIATPIQPIENEQKQRLLIISYDAIGDTVATAPLFHAIKKARPEWSVDFICRDRNIDIIKNHSAIDVIWNINFQAKPLSLNKQDKLALQTLYKQKYDKVLYLGQAMKWPVFYRILKLHANERLALPVKGLSERGIDLIGSNVFHRYIGKNRDETRQFTKRMVSILPDIGIEGSGEFNYDLNIPRKVIIKQVADNSILFNPCGTQSGNTLSADKSDEIINALIEHGYQVYVFARDEVRKCLTENAISKLNFISSTSIIDACNAIMDIGLTATTDTSIGHISSALGIKTVIIRADEAWRADGDPLSGNALIAAAENNGTIEDVSIDKIINLVQLHRSKEK